jgi:5-methylcytosine-specific restriction endonuclease McrA
MVKLPYEARLLFIGLWNFADDEGCLWDEPDRIKFQIFPGDNVDIASLLDLLVATERLDRYEDENGIRYLVVRHFTQHQRVDHPAKSLFPSRESSRKLAIPQATRRAVATKYGCAPGKSLNVQCYYCGATGTINWFRLYNGQPSAWVSFSGLELDHFQAEAEGGDQSPENMVLACMECNRSKGTKDAIAFLSNKANSMSPREPSRTLASAPAGMEGKGMEGKGRERPAATVPDQLKGFDETLRQLQGYKPSVKFFETVMSRFGHLDLELEAVKAVEWARSNGKRKGTTAFVLNWLQGVKPNSRQNGATQEPAFGRKTVLEGW